MSLLFWAPAGAAEVPVAVLAARRAEDPELAGAVWAVRGAVDAHPALRAVSITDALSSGGEGEAEAGDRARAALEQGRTAFADLDLERATEALGEAARGSPPGSPEAVEALVLLAQVRLAAKDEAGAVAAFRRVLAIRPDYALEAGAAPSVARALARARQGSAPGTSSVRIDSRPVPAAVFLDGRFVGVTPRLLTGVSAEPHAIRLEADGFRSASRGLDAKPDRSAALEMELTPARKAGLLDQVTARLPEQLASDVSGPALRDARALFFVEQVIVVDRSGEEAVVHLYDLRAGRRVRQLRATLGVDGDAGELVAALYRGLDPAAPGLTALAPEPEPEPVPAEPSTPLHERWWFWPAVGVATAAAVAVPLLLLVEEPEEGLPKRKNAGAVVLRF